MQMCLARRASLRSQHVVGDRFREARNSAFVAVELRYTYSRSESYVRSSQAGNRSRHRERIRRSGCGAPRAGVGAVSFGGSALSYSESGKDIASSTRDTYSCCMLKTVEWAAVD
jgi:hypothetical protein